MILDIILGITIFCYLNRMVTTKNRDETILQTDTVRLQAQFKDSFGMAADLDAMPSVTIVQPSGNILMGPTSIGVTHAATGLYYFDFLTGVNSSLGVYNDLWEGVLSGIPVSGTFSFVVFNTQLPSINTDGYVSLGDDVGFNYSQNAIININSLIKTLKARLDSSGKAYIVDSNGNEAYADCDIFSTQQLVAFLAESLARFNEMPFFTLFTFDDSSMIQQFHSIIVRGATLMALGSKALLERGREFVITENGLTFNPPTVSELMTTQWSTELTNYFETLKIIKASIRPFALGLGTLSSAVSVRNPYIMRLRHLRSRRLF